MVYICDAILLGHKTDEVLTPTTKWMQLEIILSEIKQSQKEISYVFLICGKYRTQKMEEPNGHFAVQLCYGLITFCF